MTRGLGRVLVGGKDCGAGFVLGPRLAVTAHHVVRGRRDNPVMYVPADGEPVAVERVQPDIDHDAAILWLAADAGESLPASAAVQGAKWRVESPPPGGNDPHLHGTVTTARMIIHNAEGQPVEVVQLEVNEQLGGFGGYSGSAVLDSPGRAVLAVLVEQKPLRIPVLPLGEKQAASNVLYAVPIKDVIVACGLLVRAARPLRFDVGLLAPGVVTRVGLLDQAVSQVIGTAGGDAGAGLVMLQGAGGLGKTVLARQVAEDARVWAEFTDGIVMLRAGQSAAADLLARQLQETLGGWDMHLADVLDRQRLLLIVDDVWDQELVITLRASLPPTVTVLATTRGVSVPGASAVPVGAVSQEEAIQILARDTARSSDLDRVLADLAKTLFHWPLLLTLAASEIHRDDELGWGLDDAQDARQGGTEPGALIRRAQILRGEFPDDLTMLDELERTGAASPPRSVKVLVKRSLDWMGPEHRPRFELLGIYPPGAAITQPMLEDLWETTPNAARKEIRLLVRAGLAQPLRTDRPTIELHDLITAWLHHEHGLPGEASHRPTHQRLAGLCHRPDGSPRTLTRDRAEWLAYHLLAAGAWDMLKALPTLSWRSTFLVATGSDATFLAALDQYGHAARVLAPDAVYHAVRAWLFAAQVRALIGALPIRMVVAMALVGDPIAGITQAGQHPEAGRAVPAVLAAVANQIDTHLLIERALTVTEGIPDAGEHSIALAGIAEWLAGAAHGDPALIKRALAVAEGIPDAGERSQALAGIAEWLAGATPADPALIKRALAVAETIIGDGEGSRALARIVGWLAGAAPGNPALIKRALAVAEALPGDRTRSQALAGIAERLAPIDPARAAALIDQALAAAQAISEDGERSQALTVIAEHLASAAPGNPALIKRALAAAQTILHDRERSQALASIATWLAAIDPARAAALIDQTLAAAQAISEDGERSLALARIAERLAGAALSDPALIKRALAVAEAIPYDGVRSQALAGIAEWLAPIDPARAAALIDQTLAAAQAIPHDWERSQALAGIAERLAPIDPARAAALIDQALAAAETIPDDLDRSRTLTVIAEHLASAAPGNPALIKRALAAAQTISGDGERSQALASIAERLPAIDPARAAALIDQALAAAQAIPHDWKHREELAAIAEGLAAIDPTRAAALIDQALAAAQSIPHDREHNQALAGIAERLAGAAPSDPALIKRALAVAQAIPDDQARSQALAGIAERLAGAAHGDPALIKRALAVAETISHGWERSQALAGIAERLAAIDPARAAAPIDQALAAAETIPDDGERSRALAGIAERLAGAAPSDPALIERALAVAQAIPHDWVRSRALAGIAKRLAGAAHGDPALIKRALAVAETIPDDQARSQALAGIAERLAAIDPARAAALIDQALAMAQAIPDGWDRSLALAGIAARLAGAALSDPALFERALAVAETSPGDPALIERALAVAQAIPDDWVRSLALAGIVERLAGAAPGDPALIDQALAAAQTIPRDWARSQALAAIPERLAGASPSDPALIDQALATAQTIPDDWERSQAIARINALTRGGMLDELSRWRLRSLDASLDLLNVFLGNCHDKVIAEMIGLAVLDTERDFSIET